MKTERSDGGDAKILGGNSRGGDVKIRGGGSVAQRSEFRDFISKLYTMNLSISVLMVAAVYGIITGAGWVLPAYSWACIGFLVSVINPIGRPERS